MKLFHKGVTPDVQAHKITECVGFGSDEMKIKTSSILVRRQRLRGLLLSLLSHSALVLFMFHCCYFSCQAFVFQVAHTKSTTFTYTSSTVQRLLRQRRQHYSTSSLLSVSLIGGERRRQNSNNNNPNKMKGAFLGSGTEGLSTPANVEQILRLLPSSKRGGGSNSGRSSSSSNNDNNANHNNTSVKVLYLGTATYDLELFRDKKTSCFIEQGCDVKALNVASAKDTGSVDISLIDNWADIIVVGGGNTLYAVDCWYGVPGMVDALHRAKNKGVVCCGGSAGAICWFHSGHSDSMDPDSYQSVMIDKYGSNSNNTAAAADDDDNDKNKNDVDESTTYEDGDTKKEWRYIRVRGLNFVKPNQTTVKTATMTFPEPNIICCPHHDKVQSNGILRSTDFDTMLIALAKTILSSGVGDIDTMKLRLNSIIGIGIDHYSSLLVDGDTYRVFGLPDKPGSVATDDEDNNNSNATTTATTTKFAVDEKGCATGKPGIWLKRIIYKEGNGTDAICVESKICPLEGKLDDLFSVQPVATAATNDDDDQKDNHNTDSMTTTTATATTIDIDSVDDKNNKDIELCRQANPSHCNKQQ